MSTTTQVHELRNRLTSAVLMATAMLEGKLAADKSNLQGLVHALEDVTNIVATVSKYDWDQSPADGQVVDVVALIQSVADELSLLASAADVRIIAAEPAEDSPTCHTLRGRSSAMYKALEGAVGALMSALPAGASIVIAPRSGEVITLTATVPGNQRLAMAHLPEIAPHLESRGGRAHVGNEPGQYWLHIPGTPVCP